MLVLRRPCRPETRGFEASTMAPDTSVPPLESRRSLTRADVITLVLVLLVALAARTLRLTVSLWLDEAWSLKAAEHLTAFDAQRPLYFLFLRQWMHVAHTELTLRLPSVVFGVAWIGVTFLIGHRFGGRVVATLAALFAALSTTQAFHAQEVRMYSLAALLLSTAALFYSWWVQGGKTRWLVAHGAFAYASLLTFTPTILGLAGLWILTALFLRGRRVVIGTLCTMAAVCAAWLPFAALAVSETDGTSWIHAPTLSLTLYLQSWAFVGFSLYTWLPFTAALWLTRGLSLLILAVAVYGAVGTRWRWPALWYFGIVLFVFAVSVTVRPIWQPRYLSPFMPALFLVTAAGIARLRERSLPFAAGLAGAILALQVGSIVSDDGPMEDWKGAADLVVRRAEAGDLVLVAREAELSAWSYYYHGPVQSRFVTEEGTPDTWFMRMTASLRDQDLTRSRVWLVRRLVTPDKMSEFVELRDRLAQSFRVEDFYYENVDVIRISAKAP